MNTTMLAAVYYGPEDLRVEERLVPTIGPDEALLKVVNTSICGTDLRIYKGGHRHYPDGTIRIPGHEVVGDIVEVGENVTSIEVGKRYFVAPNMVTAANRISVTGDNNLSKDFAAIGISMDGSFAEYMRIPAAAIIQGNLIPIAPGDDAAGCCLDRTLCLCTARAEATAYSARRQRAGRRCRTDWYYACAARTIEWCSTCLCQ